MERERDQEREHERPAEGITPEDAKPGDDMPSDRDLNPPADTDRVVEKKKQPEDG